MKIAYGLLALTLIGSGIFFFFTYTTPQVVLNEPVPVTASVSEPTSLATSSPSVPTETVERVNRDVATEVSPTNQARVANIVGTPGHPAQGNVRLLTSDTDTIRFENYQGTDGPDLFIYLTNNLDDVSSGVNLGRSKSTNGSINYTVPSNTSVADYRYVVTWCERFGVLFDYADINPE